MDGKATNDEIKQLLLGLKEKGESPSEITSFVEVMLEHSVKLDISNNAVDTCGTGGDSLGTVNISTAAALVVAGCGIPVVKHGNRAASSKSGSADVLEALGVLTSMNPEQVKESFEKCGITFCFAPTFHPAMKHVGPVRKELGVATVFNILGPLANPAQPKPCAGADRCVPPPVAARPLHRRPAPRQPARQPLAGQYRRRRPDAGVAKLFRAPFVCLQRRRPQATVGLLLPLRLLAELERGKTCRQPRLYLCVLVSRRTGCLGSGEAAGDGRPTRAISNITISKVNGHVQNPDCRRSPAVSRSDP